MYGGDSRSLASKIAKTATGKGLTIPRRTACWKNYSESSYANDTGTTATRASFIERRTAKKAAEKRMNAAVGGGAAPKKQAPKGSNKEGCTC